MRKHLLEKSISYLQTLCIDISDRSVGSSGNRKATAFFSQIAESLGWEVTQQEFEAFDWENGGAELKVNDTPLEVFASPYTLGCDVEGEVVMVSSLPELEHTPMEGKIVVVYGSLAREQLMPKNFVFYNPEEHQRIIGQLEKGRPAALVCITGKNAALAGGVYPFPLIEDGDFDIPSVYMREEEGKRLLRYRDTQAKLKILSRRIPGKGCNVIARKGDCDNGRIVVTAHIDAKKNTPGAIDNGTGVVILLLLAHLVIDHERNPGVELVALNGEDYYAVPGQMRYIAENRDRFDEIKLNINIDGAGYHRGSSAISYYGLPEHAESQVKELLRKQDDIVEGAQWPQGDHSIFIQQGCPAIAFSSSWFIENIDSQEITHTPKDNVSIVDHEKLVDIAFAIQEIIIALS